MKPQLEDVKKDCEEAMKDDKRGTARMASFFVMCALAARYEQSALELYSALERLSKHPAFEGDAPEYARTAMAKAREIWKRN